MIDEIVLENGSILLKTNPAIEMDDIAKIVTNIYSKLPDFKNFHTVIYNSRPAGSSELVRNINVHILGDKRVPFESIGSLTITKNPKIEGKVGGGKISYMIEGSDLPYLEKELTDFKSTYSQGKKRVKIFSNNAKRMVEYSTIGLIFGVAAGISSEFVEFSILGKDLTNYFQSMPESILRYGALDIALPLLPLAVLNRVMKKRSPNFDTNIEYRKSLRYAYMTGQLAGLILSKSSIKFSLYQMFNGSNSNPAPIINGYNA